MKFYDVSANGGVYPPAEEVLETFESTLRAIIYDAGGSLTLHAGTPMLLSLLGLDKEDVLVSVDGGSLVLYLESMAPEAEGIPSGEN